LRPDPSSGHHCGAAGHEIEIVTISPDAAVLVVDDVPDNRDLLVRRLARLGIKNVDQAANGKEALSAIEGKAFDLVLLDIMMPEMDGFEVLDRLKADGRMNDLPVIVISALSEIEPVVRCIELGAEDFIFKPFNPTLLRARVFATLEKKALQDQRRDELRRKQRELNEARTLQLALVPPALQETWRDKTVCVDVILEPAKEVGGDLVDYFRIGDLLVLALGDVSDKGAGAALFMARTHALFRGLSTRPDAEALFRDPHHAIASVNAALAAGNSTCMFVTFLLASFDLASRQLCYVRAGHVPPYLRRADGTIERLMTLGGPPLGLVEEAIHRSDVVALQAGDRLLVLTDGFTEAADPAGQLFGDARVEAFLAATTSPGETALQQLTAVVREFEAGQPPSDDAAALLLSLEP
jgi:phosphoserine phosphatase RsbU/P